MDPRLIRDFHQQHPKQPTKTSVGPGNPWCVTPPAPSPDPSDEEDLFSEREETSANDQGTESTLEYRFTWLVFLTADYVSVLQLGLNPTHYSIRVKPLRMIQNYS